MGRARRTGADPRRTGFSGIYAPARGLQAPAVATDTAGACDVTPPLAAGGAQTMATSRVTRDKDGACWSIRRSRRMTDRPGPDPPDLSRADVARLSKLWP